ncbi:ABC transporter permease [candidate division KSB1 bacterium]|nr:ABC transporter permease [candidate division KSB1 bacterium]
MFKNYLKTTIRNLLRNKTISFINIAGLAISMACAFLLLLWIQDEKSYDTYHNDVDRIYRIAHESQTPNSKHKNATTTGALAVALRNDYPQVEKVSRIMPQPRKVIQVTPEKRFTENNFFIVDDDFFDIFTLPFIFGSADEPFSGNQSIVISERMASKYFGEANPVGKTLQIGSSPVTVSGVIQDTPHNSHLQFDFLAPMKPIEQHPFFTNWSFQVSIFTFVKLNETVAPAQFEENIRHISKIYNGEQLAQDNTEETFFLQPMRDIYLHSNLESEAPISGSAFYIYVFHITAIIILLIASINFINLTTSRTPMRGKEIAMRKIVGAGKFQIVRQFLFEITFSVLIALILATMLSETLLSAFNNLTGKAFSHTFWWDAKFMLNAVGLFLLINAVCAIYPIFLSSAFSPAEILRKAGFHGRNLFAARRMLVVFQFALSIALIIGALTVFRQLFFIKNKDVGFNKEQVLVVPVRAPKSSGLDFYEQIKSEFTDYAAITHACVSRAIPGEGGLLSFDAWLANSSDNKKQPIQFCMIDPDFMSMYDIQMLAGRMFQNTLSDINGSIVINETASRALGFASHGEAIGKLFDPGYGAEKPLTIIGVCRNVFFESLHVPVEPLYFAMSPEWFFNNGQRPFQHISLKLQTHDLSDALAFVKSKYEELFPDRDFEYFFLDEKINQQYIRDQQFASIFNLFTGFAIFIACLGLLGLAIFNAQRRVKEIGIRKVMGASIWRLLLLLTQDSAKWVVLANIIAIPIAWYTMNNWLQNFAYRIEMSWWMFALAGALALLIALLTVSWQAIRAATANPIEALRYE